MSLFENEQYQWRETCFVLFEASHRPQADDLVGVLMDLGKGVEVSDVRADADGFFESLTIVSHDDYAAMDISYVAGEEVQEQVEELAKELSPLIESADEKRALAMLPECSARLDVYHFERNVQSAAAGAEEPDLMDPGALLSVMERLANLCEGVAVDPQAGFLT